MLTQDSKTTGFQQVKNLLENYLPTNYSQELAEKHNCHPNVVYRVRKELLNPDNVFRTKLKIDVAESLITLCKEFKNLNDHLTERPLEYKDNAGIS